MHIAVFSVLASALVAFVSAHGYVPQIKIGNNYIAGWNVPVCIDLLYDVAYYMLNQMLS